MVIDSNQTSSPLWLFAIFGVITFFSCEPLQAACDVTLNQGSDVSAAIQEATPGSTVCLNSGNYGIVGIEGVEKTNTVTLQSTSGQEATLELRVITSKHLAFANLTITSMYLGQHATDISVLNSDFKGQLQINMGPNGGNYGNANILIDGNTFDGIDACENCYEGRIEVLSELPCGVKISNNHFGNLGESDGIQVGANGVVIGPGNVFDGIRQANYRRHVDAIQLYGQSNTTITGNYFINNDVQIMAPDGGTNEIVTHNVFVGNNRYRPAIQFGSIKGGLFAHNTVINIDALFTRKKENDMNSSDLTIRDNLMVNSFFGTGISDTPGSGCPTCIFTHNLLESDDIGFDNVIGTPQFMGGSNPDSWTGYQLDSHSLGYKSATDGTNMGSNFFGEDNSPSPAPLPSAPQKPVPVLPKVPAPKSPDSSRKAPACSLSNYFKKGCIKIFQKRIKRKTYRSSLYSRTR